MPLQIKLFSPVLCLLVLPFLFFSFIPSQGEKNSFSNGEGFAVVELFTSEGCSSCPPADEVLGRLSGWKENVYFLSFHVDYWNYLGWNDAYSSAAYSDRQKEYGKLFHLKNIYTPQVILNGKAEFVGSDESGMRAAIEESLNGHARSELVLKARQENYDQIAVTCNSSASPGSRLNLALVQNQINTPVQQGENKGKLLHHFNTVRDFKVVNNPIGERTYMLHIPPGIAPSACSIIAYLQNSKNGSITAAAESPIP